MKILNVRFFSRMFLLTLVSVCGLLISQGTFAGQYAGRDGSTFTCPDNTQLVGMPEHWTEQGVLVGARYLCVPMYSQHYKYDHAVGDYSTLK